MNKRKNLRHPRRYTWTCMQFHAEVPAFPSSPSSDSQARTIFITLQSKQWTGGQSSWPVLQHLINGNYWALCVRVILTAFPTACSFAWYHIWCYLHFKQSYSYYSCASLKCIKSTKNSKWCIAERPTTSQIPLRNRWSSCKLPKYWHLCSRQLYQSERYR